MTVFVAKDMAFDQNRQLRHLSARLGKNILKHAKPPFNSKVIATSVSSISLLILRVRWYATLCIEIRFFCRLNFLTFSLLFSHNSLNDLLCRFVPFQAPLFKKSVQPPTLLLLAYLSSLRSDTVSPAFENDDPFRLSTLCLTFSKPILHVWCRNFGDVFTSLIKHGLVVTNSTAELFYLPGEATTRHFTSPP